MPVPDYETFMLPVLRLFGEGVKNVAECVPRLKAEFGISDDEAAELLPSGRVTVLQSRAHWARTYLSKAGLLESPKRNQHVITPKGREVLAASPPRIDNAFLDRFEGFREWRVRAAAEPVVNDQLDQPAARPAPATDARIESAQTPEDAMASAHKVMNAALRDDLLGLLQAMNPIRFERLILDLLAAMGYGGGDLSNGRMTRATGDGGIDGVIDEDALGLDAIYIQAKRYDPSYKVGRPDLQRFVGSLTGEGATKGVFVTTSDFSRDATSYIERVQHRIRLINGQRLAGLMIQYGVGARAQHLHHQHGGRGLFLGGLRGAWRLCRGSRAVACVPTALSSPV
ncbi:restriction endonuclease [Frigidibacter albus]|uniref:Restriction endonuclease n=1 Tax=Frigidibacter albus TaxID=1465486 RepID=A0A6L8VLX4_9RHOB|nr:restriction endonuclease [Frigidibacter albus]MZQ91358.1 restriction endonuclease [Frigidibacter albus]NBE33279.1 restriction endonuclease [Frigidibacter albus]GGH64155.1 restriction endonuclease [Frigidibacter albus]